MGVDEDPKVRWFSVNGKKVTINRIGEDDTKLVEDKKQPPAVSNVKAKIDKIEKKDGEPKTYADIVARGSIKTVTPAVSTSAAKPPKVTVTFSRDWNDQNEDEDDLSAMGEDQQSEPDTPFLDAAAEGYDERVTIEAPGPIEWMLKAAIKVGLKVTVDEEDEIMLERRQRRPIPLLGWGKKAWQGTMREQLRGTLIERLHNDVKVKVDENGNEIKPRRADMVGLPEKLDLFATNALRNGQHCHLEKCRHAKLIDSKVKEDPLHIMRLESIIAGSLRGGARLFRAKLAKTQACTLCGFHYEDQEHIFQSCEATAEVRTPFVEAMLEIANDSIYSAEMLKSTINSNKAFRSCGLMPEDMELIVEVDNCRHENEGIPEAPPLDSLSPEDRVDELWVDEFIRIFSDGSWNLLRQKTPLQCGQQGLREGHKQLQGPAPSGFHHPSRNYQVADEDLDYARQRGSRQGHQRYDHQGPQENEAREQGHLDRHRGHHREQSEQWNFEGDMDEGAYDARAHR